MEKKIAQNFYSLPLFLLESSLSVYFPFVTFVMLVSKWNRKKPDSFISYFKCWKGWLIIDFPFVTFVTGEGGGAGKMAQNIFSLPLFLLQSSLSMYFPFITLISTWTKKNPVTFVSYCKCFKGSFIIDLPFVTFFMLISKWIRKKTISFIPYFKWWKGLFYHWLSLCYINFVTGKKMAQIFFSLLLFLLESSLSVYFPFVTFVTLISTWTKKNLSLLFHIVNFEN